MSENDIYTKIKNVFNSNKCGFEAFLVSKEEPQLKKMSLSIDGLRTHLKEYITKAVCDKFLLDDAQYAQIWNIADNQKKLYILDQKEDYKPFDVENWTIEDFKEEHLDNFIGFMFVYRSDEQKIWCYQNKRSMTVTNRRRKGFFTRITKTDKGVVFEEQTDDQVKFEQTIDLLIVDGSIVTDNIQLLERSFDFQDFIQKRAKKVVQDVMATGLIDDNNKMMDYIGRGGDKGKRYYKRMLRATDSPILNMEREELFERISTVDRWKGKFQTVNGKIQISTFKEVEYLIDLLDERYTVSQVSGQEYDTEVKKKADA